MQSFEGLGGMLIAAAELEKNGLPFSALGEELKSIGATTATDLNELAAKAIRLDESLLVLVGDKRLIEAQLKGLDLPAPVELTVEGDVKGEN